MGARHVFVGLAQHFDLADSDHLPSITITSRILGVPVPFAGSIISRPFVLVLVIVIDSCLIPGVLIGRLMDELFYRFLKSRLSIRNAALDYDYAHEHEHDFFIIAINDCH